MNDDQIYNWLAQDEDLTHTARRFIHQRTNEEAARDLLDYFHKTGIDRTPREYGGIRLSRNKLRKALRQLR